ncbi:MAG: signal recognition particle protein, partial [Acholeplasmatales bacterium]|nr:signal recognition particle protein [Acholeplasmatales bacterium]
IKLASSGEKLDSLEVFHPDRMAQRILGMGDVLTLIEEAEEKFSEKDAMNLMQKMLSGKYNYNDMLKQFKMMRRLGSLSRILGFIPGLGQLRKQMQNVDEKEVYRAESIIFSMTKDERENPELIAKSSRRRQRIAKGSGVKVSDVNKVIESLNQQQDMVKQVAKNPNQQPTIPQPKVKKSKGKGKGKGRFRY